MPRGRVPSFRDLTIFEMKFFTLALEAEQTNGTNFEKFLCKYFLFLKNIQIIDLTTYNIYAFNMNVLMEIYDRQAANGLPPGCKPNTGLGTLQTFVTFIKKTKPLDMIKTKHYWWNK